VGLTSEIAVYKSCTAPSGQEPPQVLGTTNTSISFRFTLPKEIGACPIQSFELYLDDGLGGNFSSADTD